MERRTGIIIAVLAGTLMIGMAVVAFFALRTSNAILDEFQRVNNGLESSRSSLEDMFAEGHDLLNSAGCADLATLADSLHFAKEGLKARIDAFKALLNEAPRDDSDIASEVFSTDDRGVHLYLAFHRYFDLAERLSRNDSIDARIAVNADIVCSGSLPAWRMRNFFHAPRVACVAILSKFHSAAAAVEALVMKDLLAQCRASSDKRLRSP